VVLSKLPERVLTLGNAKRRKIEEEKG
jgi:hypothetical protein